MSKSKPAGRRDQPQSRQATDTTAKPVKFLPAFEPRRGMFYLLGAILVLWMLGLLAMYFFTVLPTRKQNPPPAQTFVDHPASNIVL